MKASTLLWATFPPTTIRLIKELARYISARGAEPYVVGGVVRDALLGVPTADIDVMVDGDIITLVSDIRDAWSTIMPDTVAPTRVLTFPKYHTAKLLFPQEVVPGLAVLDFSAARREHYAQPGAAPSVSRGTVEDDLTRRDFSVNAMALALGPGRFGEVVDLFRGRDDVQAKLLTVLHEKSFQDDPARLIRGARFLSRFGFAWSDQTRELVANAVAGEFIKTIKPERRLDELRKALSERNLVVTIRTLQELDLLSMVLGEISLTPGKLGLLEALEGDYRRGNPALINLAPEQWKAALVTLFRDVPEAAFGDALRSMSLPEKRVAELIQLRAGLERFYAR